MSKHFPRVSKILFYLTVMLLQLALIAGFALFYWTHAGIQWEWKSQMAMLPTQETPAMKIYNYTPKDRPLAELLRTPDSVNDLYLYNSLCTVSVKFIRENGVLPPLQQEILTQRKDLLCYRLYDEVKGVSWQVWVSTPTAQKPQIGVIRESGGTYAP